MIWYITGKPRSGKSYYAVDKLVSFAKNERYSQIYTNIGGFKFDKFENVHKLDFEIFFDDYIKKLYDEFKKAKKTMEDYDDFIVEKVKEDGYYKSAFFVDECQEYLNSDRAHLKWLFSYQGHLGFDFYFITQALGLVNAKYKYTVESVTNSVSSSNKIFSNLLSSSLLDKLFGRYKIFQKIKEYSNYGVYQIYASTRMTRADKVSTFRKVFRPEIFAYYKSGDKIKTTSPILGMVFVIFLLLAGLYAYYKYFFNANMKSQSSSSINVSSENTKSTAYTKNTNTHTSRLSVSSDTIVVTVTCRNNYCNSEYFEHLPYKLLENYKDTIYQVVYRQDMMYSTDLFIETTKEDMQIFQSFILPNNRNRKKKNTVEEVLDEI